MTWLVIHSIPLGPLNTEGRVGIQGSSPIGSKEQTGEHSAQGGRYFGSAYTGADLLSLDSIHFYHVIVQREH